MPSAESRPRSWDWVNKPMNKRTLLTLLVVVGMLVPAAGATVTTQSDSTAPHPSLATAGNQHNIEETTNYTRLYVDDRYQRLRLKPGESDSITLTVENGDEEPVAVSPTLYIPPRGQRPIDESWITIKEANTTLAPGEANEFEIVVSVPDDAELNRYGGMIAFTDEMIKYPGRPDQPVHAVSLNVEVWREPTVRIISDRYRYTQVKAGDSATREIVVENTGDQPIPVNPEVRTDDRRRYHGYSDRETIDRSWIEIAAPNEIDAGETATIEVTVSPPEDAERGDYRAELDLGLKDPARPDRDTHWQRLQLRFQVWSQPDEPFETSFAVSDETEQIELELSAGQHHRAGGELEPPGFAVTFVSPDGTEIEAEQVRVTNRGSVNLGADRPRPTLDDSTYSSRGERQTFRYQLDGPLAGSWSVKIMPENTMRFSYEITRDEST